MTSIEVMRERHEILLALEVLAKELLAQDPIDVISALELARRSRALTERWPQLQQEMAAERTPACQELAAGNKALVSNLLQLSEQMMMRIRKARGEVLERMRGAAQRRRRAPVARMGITYRA